MEESDFEGSVVLEKLAQIGKVEDFFDAIDADDFTKAKLLMKRANIDSETITIVLNKIAQSDGDH